MCKKGGGAGGVTLRFGRLCTPANAWPKLGTEARKAHLPIIVGLHCDNALWGDSKTGRTERELVECFDVDERFERRKVDFLEQSSL
jgi:hypothetical protein